MTDIILAKLEPQHSADIAAPPFGILYLADALMKKGYSVALYHELGTKDAVQNLVRKVEKEKPIFVGFSNFTTSPLHMAKKASMDIKKQCGVPVIWGGVHPTIFPEETLRHDFVDIVAIGEGEETILELAALLSRQNLNADGLSKIMGIGFKRDGRVIINERRPFIKNLDDYSPAWDLVDIEKYLLSEKHFYTQIGSKISAQKMAAVITSRGCPWRCGYCYNQSVNKRTFRAQSVSKVVKEVENLKQLGVSALIFEDDNFFASRNRALEIIRNINMPWSCSIRADYIAKWGEGFIRELAANQCFELRIGAESGSQRILDLMKKDITVEQIREAIELCSQYKIKNLLNFMVGIPGESWDDVLQTLNLIDELERSSEHVTVSSVGIYAPWPGAFLHEKAVENGFRPPKTLEGWSQFWAQRMKMAPYMDRRIKFIGFYRTLIRKDFKRLPMPALARLLRGIALLRWQKRFFRYPLDYYVPAFFLRALRKIGLAKVSQAIYE
ncbi:MAG: B12-binding domain-containing radical SAM protein [Candidatus Aminicenantes bacterium]|nr:B12-binding domain-containing radical SAM protein [Candidatus Aminicenantes bacterium]